MTKLFKLNDAITNGTAPKPRIDIVASRNACIEAAPGGLRIVMPGWAGWAPAGFISIWLYGALDFTKNDLLNILHGKSDALTIAWMLFWESHTLAAAVFLSWQLAGREIVFIDGVTIFHRMELLGLRWTRRFPLADVRDLAVSFKAAQSNANEWRPEVLEYRVSFIRGGKRYHFGWLLSHEAVSRVVRAIPESYPSVAATL